MAKINLRMAGLFVASLAAPATADAQQVISRTSDYTVYWSDSTFTGATALYAASYAIGPTAFADANFLIAILSNAQNFAYFQGGGVTVSSPAPSAPYPATTIAVFSGDGTEGFWGWQYDTDAGAGLPLSFGRLGNLATLNFDVGGSDTTTVYSPGVGYYVFVHLPGDWTTEGASTGGYIFNSVAAGFSTPTFTFADGMTTVETFTTDFATGGPNLRFALIGSVVPESSTWAMMALGFAGLGFVGWRAKPTTRAVA